MRASYCRGTWVACGKQQAGPHTYVAAQQGQRHRADLPPIHLHYPLLVLCQPQQASNEAALPCACAPADAHLQTTPSGMGSRGAQGCLVMLGSCDMWIAAEI